MDYEIGKLYKLEKSMVNGIIRAMGLGAMIIMESEPDYSRGRRYLKENEWEFWLINGKKVSLAVSRDLGFIASVSRDSDTTRPDP